MRNILSIVIVSIITIGFSACGGGGGGDASFKDSNTSNNIAIDVNCTTNPTSTNIEAYIPLQSGDAIVKDTDGTQIEIYHDINGTKRVCVVAGTGSAHIIR
jgi:hypothetical protein